MTPAPGRFLSRFLAACGLWLLAGAAAAFDLDQLGERLAAQQQISGHFVQEKHLRALPQPLVSRGQFELSAEHGLLWQVRQPVAQDYRIDEQGISRLTAQSWQKQSGQDAAAQQSRLFLAVLRGDRSGLARDFALQLSGDEQAWQLQLTPSSVLLRQIFSGIRIEGGEVVERIELSETQGDRTLLRFEQTAGADRERIDGSDGSSD